jgi:hypothetical protein
MTAEDIPAVAGLMAAEFCWSREQWLDGLAVMRDRDSPAGYPRFGYVLEHEGEVAGAILTLFAEVRHNGHPGVRCNVSSWYVAPRLRGHGLRLTRKVLAHRDVTLIDLTPKPHTRRFIEAVGFKRYTQGQYACAPALRLRGPRIRVRPYRPEDAPQLANAGEAALMADHAGYDCLSLVGEAPEGLIPFVFTLRQLRRTPLAYAQLAYCRDTADFVRCAGPLGRYLLRRRAVLAVFDGDGPAPGLPGRFIKDRWPRYYLGPEPPRANDLAYTEAVLLKV